MLFSVFFFFSRRTINWHENSFFTLVFYCFYVCVQYQTQSDPDPYCLLSAPSSTDRGCELSHLTGYEQVF